MFKFLSRFISLLLISGAAFAQTTLMNPPTGGVYQYTPVIVGTTGNVYNPNLGPQAVPTSDVLALQADGWSVPVTITSASQLPAPYNSSNPGTVLSVPGSSNISTAPSALQFVNVQCTNSADDVGINQALSLGYSVNLRGKNCAITNALNLSAGQCLAGEGDHATFLNVGAGFSSSATGVIVLTGAETASPCVHDLAINFAVPNGFSTTTTAAQASGTTITVANVANIAVGNYVYDTTTAGAIPALTTVSNISGNVLTLSTTVTGVLSGDAVFVGPARANWTTLGSCDAVYTGCQYPPGILTSGSNRPRFWNLHIQGAWNCINTQAPWSGATTNSVPSNVAPWMERIECGSINVGWQADGAQDFSHVQGWHQWVFGFQQLNSSANPYYDGYGIAWQIGRMDSLNAIDITFWSSRFVITSNATNSQAASEYSNVGLDGNASALEIAGGYSNQFVNLYKTGTGSAVSNCPINVSAGYTQINSSHVVGVSGLTSGEFCVSGGTLRYSDSYAAMNSSATVPLFYETGGNMLLEHDLFIAPTVLNATMISQTSGAIIVRESSTLANISGVGLSVASDVAANVITNNNFGNYSFTVPTGATSGFYSLTTPLVNTLTGSLAVSGTTPPTLTAGQMQIGGTSSATLANQEGVVRTSATNGLILQGKGSINDIDLVNSAGTTTIAVPTGTSNVSISGNVVSSGIISATGTSTPTMSSGVLAIYGIGNTPTFAGTGEAIERLSTTNGLVLTGDGSSIDTGLGNHTGALAWGVASGTTHVASLTGTYLTASALSSCGTTPAISSASTDTKGTITEGTTATGCVLTFSSAYATVPDCIVTSPSGVIPTSYSVTTVALTIANVSASNDKFTYFCVQ
jgi:hypothetical protein